MCKLNDRDFITLGSFPVLNLNGEGADATIKTVESVSLIAERLGDTDNNGQTEWAFEAHYHTNLLNNEYDRIEPNIRLYEVVLISDLNEFISAFAHFVHNVNNTSLATRLGFFTLKADNLTREEVRASLLVHYQIDE